MIVMFSLIFLLKYFLSLLKGSFANSSNAHLSLFSCIQLKKLKYNHFAARVEKYIRDANTKASIKRSTNTFNLFCSISAKRVEKRRCFPVLQPSFKPVVNNLICRKTGLIFGW